MVTIGIITIIKVNFLEKFTACLEIYVNDKYYLENALILNSISQQRNKKKTDVGP